MSHVLESPEEVLTTLTREGKRRWIYPIPSPGRLNTQRRVVAYFLMALYLLLPIVHIDGRPAILLDVMNREFAIFGAVFYPTDTILLMMLGVGGILLIVVLTALLGRVWCGWGCPQTVSYTHLTLPTNREV